MTASGGTEEIPPDAGVGGMAGATAPVASSGGAGTTGGATIPTTGGGGAGGASIPVTASGGVGGQSSVATDGGPADGPIVTIDSGPPADVRAVDAPLVTPSCGDGIVLAPEACDDGNVGAGDGCSPSCRIEMGFKCSGSPSVCTLATCGDGKMEGTEGCDDGNNVPFDGCSAECQNEPNCNGEACTSRCGDGLVIGEECDDGNTLDGDGCSKDCTIEPGFTCSQPELGDRMTVPAVYRDFRFGNPADFEKGITGRTTVFKGMVAASLDGDRKPVYTEIGGYAYVTSTGTFTQWYRNFDGVNHATSSRLTLWNNGKGAFVNRYGANGQRWQITQTVLYCGTVGNELLDDNGLAIPCTSKYQATEPTDCTKNLAAGQTMLKCYLVNGTYQASFLAEEVDGNPLFFPVDGDGFTPQSELRGAQVSPPYDATLAYPWDMDESGNKRLHNFSFTSEVRYWFQYDKNKSYTLDFTGDDDVWVFINKKLAVDLGGIHTPVNGSVTLDATTAPGFGLMDGKVYEVAVFQAERQSTGSTYRLTLSGFNTAPSKCLPL